MKGSAVEVAGARLGVDAPSPWSLGSSRGTDTGRRARAQARLAEVRESMRSCRWCHLECGVDRSGGGRGPCGAGREARFFSAQTEVTDELEWLPTYAVALSGCQLRCDFCVTGAASWNAKVGEVWQAGAMAERVRKAVSGGARSVMVLGGEPVLHLTAVLELAAMVPEEVPLVLKTNGCFGCEARRFLAGVIDVWLPDFKFGNDECARRLAGVEGYWAVLTANLEWMVGEHGGEVVVRHLLMPGHGECCWEPVARWLGSQGRGVRVSLREGYVPAWKADRHAELRRWVGRAEMERARQVAAVCGLELVP